MLNVEPVPIEVFVVQVMSTKEAQQITDNWPLKSEAILSVVIKHFHDLGVFQIKPFGQDDVMRQELLFFLRNSPQILDMIDKAKRAAAAAAQRGRANTEG